MQDTDLIEVERQASGNSAAIPADKKRPAKGSNDFVIPKNKAKSSQNKISRKNTATVHGAGNTTWWFDARNIDDKAVLHEVEVGNCTHIVLLPSQLDAVKTSKKRVLWIQNKSELESIPQDCWVLTPDEKIRVSAKSRGHKAGLMLHVKDLKAEFPACIELCERGDDFVVIDIEHATYIPYELLIAKAEETGTQVLRSVPINGLNNVVDEVDQSLNALATMEQGVGVLFRSQDIETLRSLSVLLRGRQSIEMPLLEAEVVEVLHTGLGHRVCVDTTSLMTAEEGIIVGSTGWGGIFVCSETHFLPHMNLREFRVNAGSVHSYVWTPEGKALYLSEIHAGSEVLCVNKDGTARVVVVGRAKIERRPLLKVLCRIPLTELDPHMRELIEAEATSRRRVTPENEEIAGADEHYLYINTFLQNDWHVRVMGADGVVRHSTLLRPGDRLLAHVDKPGRHTGVRVTEHIIEK